jgi:hypothetical protein
MFALPGQVECRPGREGAEWLEQLDHPEALE